MKKLSTLLLGLVLASQLVWAGLPPTTSKVSGDSNDVTTFKYQFPNFAGTHTGTTLSLGILGTSGGGTGNATGTATNVTTTATTTNASYFPLMAASSSNGSQAANLSSSLTLNPSTMLMSLGGGGLYSSTNGSETSACGMSSATRFSCNNTTHAGATFLQYATNTTYMGLGVGTFSNDWYVSVNSSSTDTSPATQLVPNTTTSSILDLRNTSSTANNYSALVFSGSTDKMTSGIVGVNDVHTAASETGHLEFLVNNSGTKARAMKIGADKTLTLDGYGEGTLRTDTSGNVTASGVKPAEGGAVNFVGQTTTWVPSNLSDRGLEASVGNWLAFANTVAGSLPDNGMTGGSPSVTCTRSTTNPLDGAASLLVTKGASNRQGDGCSVVFNVQPAYQGSTATITASLNISSGSLVQGDVKLFIYDVTNSLLITPYNNDVIAGPTLTATFPLTARAATPANQQYRLGIYFASTSTTAVNLQLDDFSVSPGVAAYGMAGSNRNSFTMSITGSTSNPTKATSPAVDAAYWWRVGSSMHIHYDYRHTSATGSAAGSGNYLFGIPSGYTIDTSVTGSSSTGTIGAVGPFHSINNSGSDLRATGTINVADSTHLVAVATQDASGAGGGVIGSTFHAITDTTVDYSFDATVPIAGWDANVTMASSSTYKISSYLANGTRVTTTPANLGEYRTQYFTTGSSITLGEATAPPAPTVADGMHVYARAWSATQTTSQPAKWDIFVGKNKSVKLIAYSGTGRTGTLDPSLLVSTNDYGLLTNYDPTTGIYTVFARNLQASGTHYVGRSGFDATNTGSDATDGYFDVQVSENALAVGAQAPRSSVTANTGNGYGSTNTKIRRFTNSTTTGTAITYADSATLGATFTLNEDGVYSVSSSDASTAGAFPMGISLNTTTPTTGIDSIAVAQRVISLSTAGANFFGSASGTIIGHAGDVVRAHTDGSAGSTSAQVQFIITKVSN